MYIYLHPTIRQASVQALMTINVNNDIVLQPRYIIRNQVRGKSEPALGCNAPVICNRAPPRHPTLTYRVGWGIAGLRCEAMTFFIVPTVWDWVLTLGSLPQVEFSKSWAISVPQIPGH